MADLTKLSDEKLNARRDELQAQLEAARTEFIEIGKELDRRVRLTQMPKREDLEKQLAELKALERKGE